MTKTTFKKLFFTLVLILSNSYCFGQIGFEDRTLAFLQSIAFQGTYDKILPMFKTMNVEGEKIVNEDKTESFYFKISDEKSVSVVYSADKKMIYTQIYYGFSKGLDIYYDMEKVLRENNFENYSDKSKPFDPIITHYYKKDYPYEFIIDVMYPRIRRAYIFNKEFGSLEKFINK